jgi:hypothetical protein
MYYIEHKTDAFQVFQAIGAAREHIATFKRERDAKAFVAGPALLNALQSTSHELRHWNHWATTTRPGYENIDGWSITCTALRVADAAIKQATK